MKFSWSEPGAVISAVVHAALLLATLIAFSSASKFEDAKEPVAIETVSDAQFNQIMRGEKKGEKTPHPKVEKVAAVEVQKPTPPTPDAKTDVPAPPPPLKHTADPGHDDQAAEAPKPPTPVAALPPPRPEPEKIEPPIPEPRPPTPPTPTPPTPVKAQPEAKKPPPPPKPDAEPIENAGKPITKAEVQPPPPLPPAKPRPQEKKVQAKPKNAPKPLNEDAKLLEELAAAAVEKPVKPTPKPPSKPKSGDELPKPTRRMDDNEIRQILSHEDPQSTGSTGRQLNRVASLGSPNSDDAKTTPSKLNELDDILLEQYKRCWVKQGYTAETTYVAVVAAEYNRDGTLKSEPYLENTPSDPGLRVLAESALDAVRKCNPLRVPPEFQTYAYYQHWRARGLRFDPRDD